MDLIYRQVVIDAVKRLSRGETDAVKVALMIEDYLKHLPSAQPEVDCQKCIFCGFAGFNQFQTAQQWIPCSERLPEDGTEVFVYLYHNPESPYIAWIEDSRWYTEEFEVEREHEPLAWMPLPSPWKGEGNE